VPLLARSITKGLKRTMKITDADHTNWRVRDVERSLGFYRDILGLEPFGLEEYERGEHPLVSLRVTPEFILHLRPDPTFEATSTGGYDHLALVVEDTNPDALAERLKEAGVEIEGRSENVIGARGSGVALYVRDPDGYLIELKLYDVEPGVPRTE
jgi:catechol 2,3-dioxygenase-like lactoylglutathione lyase family enzyme